MLPYYPKTVPLYFYSDTKFYAKCISNQMKLKDSDIKKILPFSRQCGWNMVFELWGMFQDYPYAWQMVSIFGQIYANMPKSESLSAKIWNSCSNVIQNSGNGVLNITFVYIIIMIWRFKIIQVQSFVLIK